MFFLISTTSHTLLYTNSYLFGQGCFSSIFIWLIATYLWLSGYTSLSLAGSLSLWNSFMSCYGQTSPYNFLLSDRKHWSKFLVSDCSIECLLWDKELLEGRDHVWLLSPWIPEPNIIWNTLLHLQCHSIQVQKELSGNAVSYLSALNESCLAQNRIHTARVRPLFSTESCCIWIWCLELWLRLWYHKKIQA